jgi:branched-chain amino acid transport system permease protein
MSTVLGYVVSGLANGAVYALIAMAASLAFKASRVANLAVGETGTFSAFALYWVAVKLGLPYWVGFIAALACGALLSVLTQELIVKRVEIGTLVLVGTLGISDILTGTNTLLWAGHEPYQEPSLPAPHSPVVGGVTIPGSYLTIFVVLIVIGALLYVLLERTTFGISLRAAAESHDTAALTGINVRARVLTMWALSGALVALAAMLIAPLSALSVTLMTALLFKGYSAGILGGLDSLSGALAGGLGLGLAEALISAEVSSTSQDAVLFALVILLLAIRPQGLLARRVFVRV